MALASVLLGLFASVYEIVKERSVYQRERMVTLQILPYIASKVVVLGAFALIQCFLLMLVISLKVEMPKEGVFLPAPVEMYITLLLGTLAAITDGAADLGHRAQRQHGDLPRLSSAVLPDDLCRRAL